MAAKKKAKKSSKKSPKKTRKPKKATPVTIPEPFEGDGYINEDEYIMPGEEEDDDFSYGGEA